MRLIEGTDLYYATTCGKIIKAPQRGTNRRYMVMKGGLVHGYYYVGIKYVETNKRVTKRVHRLIAKAFLPNPESKPFINHINGIKSDNRLANLEWCTGSENNKHSFILGKSKTDSGANDSQSKPVAMYNLSGKLVSVYGSCKEASRILSIHSTFVSRNATSEKKSGRKGVYFEFISKEVYESEQKKGLCYDGIKLYWNKK